MKIARRRLTRKLIPLLLLPLVAGFVFLGAVSVGVWRAALVDDADRRLADHAATLRAALSVSRPAGAGELAALVSAIAATESVHGVALYDPRGQPIARSAPLDIEPDRIDAIARRTLATGEVHHRVESLGARRALVRAERVHGAGSIGVAVLARDAAPIERMVTRAEARIAIAGGALCLVTLAIALWMARVLGGGLGQLVDAALRLAAGESAIAPIEGSRFLELDRVARAMNDLAAGLSEARARAESAEAARGALEQRIIHAQALAVLGQVASSVAHEVGSPLGTILGWSRLSAAEESFPPEARAQFEMIAKQCDRIARIVERMLSLARPPRERREVVRLADVAREVTSFLAPELRARGIALTLDASPSAPSVLAVRDQLAQVLLNLCLNAVQIQPDGGALRISIVARTTGAERAVAVEVADAGPGVPPDQRARIFEPFYSTKVERGGTGLGLAVVADIVRELGGRVNVGDAPEGGALFSIVLPAAG
jgi:signal transduction histidine kinase